MIVLFLKYSNKGMYAYYYLGEGGGLGNHFIN